MHPFVEAKVRLELRRHAREAGLSLGDARKRVAALAAGQIDAAFAAHGLAAPTESTHPTLDKVVQWLKDNWQTILKVILSLLPLLLAI